jgi:hypothetical protein
MFKALPVLLLCASAAFAQSNPELEKANRFLFDQKFAEASRALEAAAKVPNNSRETVLRIYELQGIVYGQLGQSTKAREAFQMMLSLDPKRELNGKYNQKVTAAFAAAKDWASVNPALEFKAAKAALSDKGRVMQLAAKVKNDLMKMVKKVRFHIKVDEGKWTVAESELQGAYAAADIDAAGVEWWAELLGENDRVLMLAGTESAPVREGKVKNPTPVAVADAPKKEKEKEKEPEKEEVKVAESKVTPVERTEVRREADEPATSSSPLRPLGIALVGVGVVGVGVGAAFGVMSNGARSRISGAAKDSLDRVTGITQKEAYALDASAKSNATLANVMFGVGAGVAIVGGILWIVGGTSSSSESASLSVSPTVGGVVASGTF